MDEKYDDEFYKLIESGYGDVIINGGTIDLDVYSTGISSDEKDVRITGGDLYLRTTGASDAGIRAENNVTITGGRIVIPETEGRGIYVHGESGQISLSWTSLSDSYDISTYERWSKNLNRVVGLDVIINRCFNCGNDGNKFAVAPGVISDNSIWGGTLTPKCFAGHSLTLNGDIGVNFFLDVPASDAANAKVEFSYTVGGKEKKSSVELKNAELTAEGYKATCYVSAPEMTDDITAVLSFGEDEFETDHYSVKTYADKLLSDEYKAEYLEKEGNTEETYTKLAALVTAMLNYGGAAQIQFEDQHPNDECGMANDGLAAPAPLTQAELSAIDSALSYVRSVLTDETADETPVDTVTAMYRYHEAAVAYFPMNNG